MVKTVCILGGGTSGLVTALILKAVYNKIDITLIKSKDIGIIGVGEGSTEHWARFMSVVGISVYDLIRETDATFKTGIKFYNWNGDGDYYFHSIHSSYLNENSVGTAYIYPGMIANGLSHHQLVPDNIHQSTHFEPYESSVNQFHFNTVKLNDFLLRLCAERKIKVIDTVIKDVILDDKGFIDRIQSADSLEFKSDLYVDCSGFRRILSTPLGARWIDCSKYLPMNSAIAFPTEKQEDIPSHTLSSAMSSGWMWRIPTQERFGNGYVYSDEFLSLDEAILEAQTCFTHKIEIAKNIKFTAGYVDQFWIKNCISVGLSGSFVEPLEASSIGTSIQQAFAISTHLPSYDRDNLEATKLYNLHFENVAKNIIDFVQIHYITKRNDTDFWKFCKHLTLTEFNKETLDLFKRTIPTAGFFAKPFLLFKDVNWIMVMHGLGMFDIDRLRNYMLSQNDDILYSVNDVVNNTRTFIESQSKLSHRNTLEEMKKRNSVQVIKYDN